MDWLTVLKQLLELGWPAIVTAMFGYLALQYIGDQRKQIDTLWDRVKTLETELIKVKSALLEAHLLANGEASASRPRPDVPSPNQRI